MKTANEIKAEIDNYERIKEDNEGHIEQLRKKIDDLNASIQECESVISKLSLTLHLSYSQSHIYKKR